MTNNDRRRTLCPPPTYKGLRLSSMFHRRADASAYFLEQVNSSRRLAGKLPLTQKDLKYLAVRSPALRLPTQAAVTFRSVQGLCSTESLSKYSDLSLVMTRTELIAKQAD